MKREKIRTRDERQEPKELERGRVEEEACSVYSARREGLGVESGWSDAASACLVERGAREEEDGTRRRRKERSSSTHLEQGPGIVRLLLFSRWWSLSKSAMAVKR